MNAEAERGERFEVADTFIGSELFSLECSVSTAAIPALGSALASFDIEDDIALDFFRRPCFDPEIEY